MSKSGNISRLAAAGRTSYADETHRRREYYLRLSEMIGAQDRDCQTVIKQVNGPAEPDAFYWHLYCNGDKVNGGLVEGTITDAERCAEMYRRIYVRSAVLASHAWDHETATWIPKEELNLM